MRKLLLVPLLLLGIAPFAGASPMTQTDIDQLVQKLQSLHNSQPSLEANFREERHLSMLKEPVVNEGKVWFTLPDKIRREIAGKTPSTTVIDGKKMWIYYPNYKQLEIYDLDKRPAIKDSLRALTAGLNFREVATYYNITGSKNGSEYQITLTPKTASVRKLVKSVDLTLDENLTPVRVLVHDIKGQVIMVTYSDVRRETLPSSTFEFSPPPGIKVSTPLGN
ncbi:MAG: outer membrane lipoprotein carrier protein LolA [Verrucomicrobia bacterium]|nr:outer membrane lipoprotein carrier protein LolA [Verrucomicrobiota bacterium]